MLYQLSYSRIEVPYLNFTAGTGCALYEKSFVPQALKHKSSFKCRQNRQSAEILSISAAERPFFERSPAVRLAGAMS
ncbi:hypothetical protein [Musicola paradisiaca]|uniref:hypothetical protein n=1 Tax=Musicola paradisiaca TaxID=69223 RepID=UPI0003C7F144|nr:hypothetical protein [Musicola paradisiaca]